MHSLKDKAYDISIIDREQDILFIRVHDESDIEYWFSSWGESDCAAGQIYIVDGEIHWSAGHYSGAELSKIWDDDDPKISSSIIKEAIFSILAERVLLNE